MSEKYNQLFCRNIDYIAQDIQNKIRTTPVLIAGCGIGSTIAEAAARMGFENITLIDGDVIEVHNLNRQIYTQADVGTKKAEALANRLRSINPDINITPITDWISEENVNSLVGKAELIFDTIDFLDLNAITILHDEANRQNKPIISALSIGWGAGAMYCPPSKSDVSYFRKVFHLPETGPVKDMSYVFHFKVLIERIGAYLNPEVIAAMSKAFQIMEDGRPCPASQLSAGSFSVGALAVTVAVKLLKEEKVAEAPNLILLNVNGVCEQSDINLLVD
ncbi:MAG: ThiF family adenylyltransferase [Candidatus Omnitrophica bacterium]|nr:ThiF family adenylyltransferase [Candidatus Omnitrophota bacterium]